jgi:hypothetical protein
MTKKGLVSARYECLNEWEYFGWVADGAEVLVAMKGWNTPGALDGDPEQTAPDMDATEWVTEVVRLAFGPPNGNLGIRAFVFDCSEDLYRFRDGLGYDCPADFRFRSPGRPPIAR